MPKLDGLEILVLGLNSYVIYSQSRLSLNELIEPASGGPALILQLSAVMGFVYLLDYMGDEEKSRSRGIGEEDKSFTEWIAGLVDNSTIADIVTIGVVFLGFQQISSMSEYGTSLFEISANLPNIAMQLSVLMIINFGLQFIADWGDD